jgi:oxalate decarboxylase/phosphoglucose isomerase-like protein (cupin superfamily)
VVAMPAGAQHWLYNDGDTPLVAIYVFDTNNNINQLEPSMRVLLAPSFISHYNISSINLLFFL